MTVYSAYFERTVGKDVTLGVLLAGACLTGVLYLLDRSEEISLSLISTSAIDYSIPAELSNR
jgi:hypothetical protein